MQKSGAIMLSFTALITICFAPALVQQKDETNYVHHHTYRPIAVSYLA